MPSFSLDPTQLMTEVYSYPFPEVRQLLNGISLGTNGRRPNQLLKTDKPNTTNTPHVSPPTSTAAESSARVGTPLINARRSRQSPRSPRFRPYEKGIEESEGFEHWIGVDGCFERAKSGEDGVCNIGKYRNRN
jgi:hypothetical protein